MVAEAHTRGDGWGWRKRLGITWRGEMLCSKCVAIEIVFEVEVILSSFPPGGSENQTYLSILPKAPSDAGLWGDNYVSSKTKSAKINEMPRGNGDYVFRYTRKGEKLVMPFRHEKYSVSQEPSLCCTRFFS